MSGHFAFERTLRVAACLLAALAAGCGGGDDNPPPPELLQITAGNQVAVATAVSVSFGVLDSTRDVPLPNPSGSPSASGAEASTKHALGTAIAAAGRAVPLATGSVTAPCAAGGSLTITIDDRDNNGAPSAGDVLTATFNDCRDDPSSLVTGSFAVAITSYAEPVVSGLFTFNQLSVTDDEAAVAVNGQASITYATSIDSAGTLTTRVDMKVAAAGLVSALSSPTYRETFTFAPDFSGVWNDVLPEAAPEYSTVVLNGKVGFASLGKVVLATDPPIRVAEEDDGPQSGAVLITGYQSRLRLSVVSTTTARLELDANNDGTFESTREIRWEELLPF